MLGQRVSLQGFAVSPGSKEVSPLSAQKMECMSTVTNCPQRIVRPEKIWKLSSNAGGQFLENYEHFFLKEQVRQS